MFQLDLRSRLPIYMQIVEKLKELIINNVLKPDEQLPSVRALAQQIAINPNTIQKAYRELESQGYAYSIVGRGSFVYDIQHGETNEKLEKIKVSLEKMMSEALYIGLTNEELLQMVENVSAKREDYHD